MDISNGRIGFTQDLDNQKFLNALRQSNKGVEDFNIHLQNHFNQSTGAVNTLTKGVAAFLTVDYATQFVSQLVKVRGEFEQLEIAFTTMLGSKEKADSLMQEIVTFAATTPFGLQSTSEATKMLLAYGESADTALDTMRKLGDIASGVGIPLKDIAYLYGTTMTQGRLYTQDLNQFLGRGIPMMDELAKILGVSKNEVKGLVEAGKVGFPEVQKVIDNLTASGSMFGGLMEAQSKSVAGQFEQLKDTVDVMFNEIGKDSQGFVTSVISGASSVVENYEAIGKTIAVLVATYGTYKAVLIVLNVIEKARLTTTLAIGAAEGRVTAMQALRYISTLKLTAAQNALNAAMMANPYAIVITAVVALGTAYFLLRDTTTAAEKAQEAYNKTQEEVKSKLDETKQKAEEYISILKDETATVYQQIEAYKALQLLKLKGFENLSQEQVQAMDVNELKKLINEANDVKGLDLQKQKLVEIENQIDSVKNQIQQMNKAQGHTGLALSDAYNKLEVLNKQYDIQLSKVNQIDRDMKFANMTLEQKKAYWESIISTTEKQIFTLSNVNTNQEQGLNLAQQVSNAFQSWDVSRLNFQLNEAQNQLIAINGQINSAIPEIKNKSYWDTKKSDATSKRDKLDPKDPRNKEEWNKLTNEINEADNALKAWSVTSTKVAKPKSIKPSKKSDDPFEIYKKQIQSVKEDYERFVNYMNSDDLVLKNSGKIQYETLSRSGATYEEFLRRLQKQLVETSNKSALQVKQLRFINDELVKVIDYNAFDKFKEGIENSISESENLLEVLGKIQEEKLKLQGNTDQISIDKLKFLDEKEIENIKNIDKASKDLVKSFGSGMSELQIKTNEYNNDIAYLTESLKNAKTEAEKIQINDAIWKRGVKFAEDTKDLPTNDDNYNKLLLEFKSFTQKKEQIETDFNNKIAVAKLNSDQTLENELLKQKKSALSKISLEYMQQSKSMMTLLGDLDKTTIKQLDQAINDIEKQLKDTDLSLEMNPEDLKAVLDALKKAKEKIQKANPFKGIQDSWNAFWNASTDEDKLESLDQFLGSVNGALELTKVTIDAAADVVESFGGKLDDAAKQTIQSIQNIVNGIGNVIQGYFSGDIAQMVAGIVQIVVEVAKLIGGSKDKKRVKAINNHVNAVRELQRAYDDLKYSIDKALGSGSYNMNKDLIKNLEQQNKELEAAIKLEESRKKSKKDQNKINDWKDQITANIRSIQDILDDLAKDILQTDAKDLATTLGDALAEAFGKGEDAVKSFEKVANDVLKNAILNQLKKKFLEEQLQGALDKLYEDMGGSKDGTFNFNGLSPEEQQAFKDKIKEISQNFTGMLDEYSDLFKDIIDPNESAMAGAIKGMSEETGNALLGQFNAIRILQKELVTINIDSNKILLNSLDRLANIDYNTRSVLPLLEKLINRIDNAGRAYGF